MPSSGPSYLVILYLTLIKQFSRKTYNNHFLTIIASSMYVCVYTVSMKECACACVCKRVRRLCMRARVFHFHSSPPLYLRRDVPFNRFSFLQFRFFFSLLVLILPCRWLLPPITFVSLAER